MSILNRLCLLALSVLVFASCQKEVDFTDTNGGGGGNGGGGPVSNSSFVPSTAGSWWKYKDSTTGRLATQTATSVTRMINGYLHRAIVLDTQADTGWTAAAQPNYFILQKGVSPAGSVYDLNFHYLNDTAAVGHSWKYDAGHGNGLTAFVETTIVGKGLTMTVGGKTYTNVSHTSLRLSYDVGGVIIEMADYDFYIARGVGIIKSRTYINALGTTLEACSDLVEHLIK